MSDTEVVVGHVDVGASVRAVVGVAARFLQTPRHRQSDPARHAALLQRLLEPYRLPSPRYTRNESVPKIIVSDAISLLF